MLLRKSKEQVKRDHRDLIYKRQVAFNQKWHSWTKWFAWYPVRVITGQLIWLELVERKGYAHGIDYFSTIKKYRRIKS